MAVPNDVSPFAGMIEEFRQGSEDLVVELPHSWVYLGKEQFHKGYCVVLSKQYVVELHHLPSDVCREYLEEVVMVSAAVQYATGCHKLNIESLGNIARHLHTHVFPRYPDEPEAYRLQPVWRYPAEIRERSLSRFEKMQITASIRAEIVRQLQQKAVARKAPNAAPAAPGGGCASKGA